MWRFGQTKSCYMYRVILDGTIDSKILQLQDRKAREIDHALQDDGHKPTRLTEEQLTYLLTGQMDAHDEREMEEILGEASNAQGKGKEDETGDGNNEDAEMEDNEA